MTKLVILPVVIIGVPVVIALLSKEPIFIPGKPTETTVIIVYGKER
jgi:hypothetical protein